MTKFEFDLTDYNDKCVVEEENSDMNNTLIDQVYSTNKHNTGEGMKITITKTSCVDNYIWTASIGNKEFTQTGRKGVRACSSFIVDVLCEISGLQVRTLGSSDKYAIGLNQILVDYVDCIKAIKFNTEFNSPEELKEYLVHTVIAIKSKVVETKKEESVSFNILY